MDVRRAFAVIVGKIIIYGSRLAGNQGTDFPGRVALKIDPQLLRKLAGQIRRHRIVVTGTNGKTTTSNMSAAILREAGLSVVHNRAGANMMSGITTAFIRSAGLSGRCERDCALLETDEANVPLLLRELTPDYIVITNFFRDQLDRYGELDQTIRLIGDSVKEQDITLILNADDPLQAHFLSAQHTRFYGLDATDYDTATGADSREGRFCVLCGAELRYEYFHYAHLGAYDCPSCGNHNPIAAHHGSRLQLGADIRLDVNGLTLHSPYQGFYNAYNILAAVALSRELGIDDAIIAAAIAAYRPRAGRLERFTVAGKAVTLVLVKNPTGLDQSLHGLSQDPAAKALCFILNDNAADGRDVSWIWDADLERICDPAAGITHFVASGLRSGDIALRALYAGWERSRITVEDKPAAAIASAIAAAAANGAEHTYVFSTYTALFECRRILRRYAKRFPLSVGNAEGAAPAGEGA